MATLGVLSVNASPNHQGWEGMLTVPYGFYTAQNGERLVVYLTRGEVV